jgi:excisionase family DNA binding protein
MIQLSKCMYYLIIDTCVWFSLCWKDSEELLEKIAGLVEQKKVKLILPLVIINEWGRQKLKIPKNRDQYIRKGIDSAVILAQYLDPGVVETFKEILSSISKIVEDDVSKRIERVDYLFDYKTTIVLPITDSAKLQAADFALAKKAPFGDKNSMTDAMIIFCATEYVKREGLTNCIFVSSNTGDFSVKSGSDELHTDLKELFEGIGIRYFINIGEAINAVEANLISEESIQQIDEELAINTFYEQLDQAMKIYDVTAPMRKIYEQLDQVMKVYDVTEPMRKIYEQFYQAMKVYDVTAPMRKIYEQFYQTMKVYDVTEPMRRFYEQFDQAIKGYNATEPMRRIFKQYNQAIKRYNATGLTRMATMSQKNGTALPIKKEQDEAQESKGTGDYVTTKEAAELLGVSRARVAALIKNGRLRAKKAGRAWLIFRFDLDKFTM